MQRIVGWIALLLAIVIWRNGRTMKNFLILSDYPAGYYAHGNWEEHCQVIKDSDGAMSYCEDATFWDFTDGEGNHLARHVLVGCDPGRKGWNTVMGPLRDPNPRGSLWLYTPESAAPRRIELKDYPEGHDFHPLGMEIYPSRAGAPSNLFVVNHARARTVIEQFTISPAAPALARWVRTIDSPYFVSPNAVALTSPTSFYVSNDHLITRRLPWPVGNVLPLLESLLALPFAWLAHVSLDTESGTPKIEHTFSAFGVPFANGVSISPDGRTVALSATSIGKVYFYGRDVETNAVTFSHTVSLPFTPDNLVYSDDGVLIAAGHPHFPSLIKVAANKTQRAPSWVVALSPRSVDTEVESPGSSALPKEYDLRAPVSASSKVPPVISHEMETLFQSNGTALSTSSTGLRDAATNVLYVTGLYDSGLLVCKP